MATYDLDELDGYLSERQSRKNKNELDDLDRYLEARSTTPRAVKSDVNVAPRSLGAEAGRQVGLTARYLAEGSPYTTIPLAIGDAANSAINLGTRGINRLFGSNIPEFSMPSQEFSNILTSAGLPKPEGRLERVVGDISRGVSGAGGSVGAGQLLQGATSPVAAGVGNTLAASPIAQTLASGSGAAAGGITREAGGDDLAQLGASLAGSFAPGAVAAGANKSMNLISGGGVRPEVANMAKIASDKFGIDIPAAQISQNPFVRWLDSVLPSIPFSGHGGELENARSQFTRAVSRTFGEDSASLTRDVMADAGDKIGAKFQSIAKNTPSILLDDMMLDKLGNIEADARDVLGADASKITNQINKILQLSTKDGAISGDSWNALMRTGTPLDRLAKSTDPNVSYYARNIKDALYDGLENSASPDMVESLRAAKGQWKNYKTVQDLAAKSGITGEINPVLLLHKTNQTAKRFGSGNLSDLENLSDIGQTFFKSMPSSGTSERQLMYRLIGGAGAGAGSLGTAILTGNAPAALGVLGGAAGSVVASKLASKALKSDYYKNMLLQQQPTDYLSPGLLGTGENLLANR